jgi:hypothetical protein
MTFKGKIAAKLQEKLGFTEPNEAGSVAKELLKDKVTLFFYLGNEDDEDDVPSLGFMVDKSAGKWLYENLDVELRNTLMDKYCGNKQADGEEISYIIQVASSNTAVDWIVAATEELERRAIWVIDNK